MKPLAISTCPSCSGRLPFWSHITFNQFIGIECLGCKAVLTHQNYTFLVKCGLLVLFVFSLSRLIDGNIAAHWIVLCVASFVLLMLLQLSFAFVVKYRGD